MPDPLPPPSLSHAREQTIAQLSDQFANDNLSLDDLERRIERVYKAASLAELDAITADLTRRVPATLSHTNVNDRARDSAPAFAPVSGVPMPYGLEPVPATSRMLAIMSETRRKGRWAVPRRLDVLALMADAKLDFTQAVMPSGVVDVHINCMWAACKLVVPRGMRVINEMHAIMGSARSSADELPPPGAAGADMPVIRLRGIALMGEVKVVVDKRGRSRYEDDDA
jgi:hypothetical protein